MVKSSEPSVPLRESEGKEQEECYQSEDLECRRENLARALMHKGALEERKTDKEGEESRGKIAQAVKLSSEFLASIIVGAVLGLGFDKLAGSLPWGLVFFLFLGFAAGVLSILRSVGYVASSPLRQKGVLRQDKGADKRSDK
ncbi:AtpZ/AtpI family protein [Bartonella machadoae]|uniref:AtpZ/AtpI family protein n=1 Tax=Bartonella machadoae TaxID=2893471 RepID=UPI001F4D3122|nr:AtpZ/AtpI family protein [Bartonella machadoae]UNE54691.1 AtpZ/AtpI family protein [Bartonella machadoae]